MICSLECNALSFCIWSRVFYFIFFYYYDYLLLIRIFRVFVVVGVVVLLNFFLSQSCWMLSFIRGFFFLSLLASSLFYSPDVDVYVVVILLLRTTIFSIVNNDCTERATHTYIHTMFKQTNLQLMSAELVQPAFFSSLATIRSLNLLVLLVLMLLLVLLLLLLLLRLL